MSSSFSINTPSRTGDLEFDGVKQDVSAMMQKNKARKRSGYVFHYNGRVFHSLGELGKYMVAHGQLNPGLM